MATIMCKRIFCFQKLKFVITSTTLQNTSIYRTSHPVRNLSFTVKQFSLQHCRRTTLLRSSSSGLVFSRHLSAADVATTPGYIPPVPVIPQEVLDVATSTLGLVEPSLASQGLCAWTPVGLIEHLLEFLHITGGLPWWVSISLATICARLLLFPVFVRIQRNSANLCNLMPQMQVLQNKIMEARQNGNAMEVSKLTNELMTFMKEKNCNPMRSMLGPLAQAPIFISFFFALRKMSNLPIESFKEGGALWFMDLTVTDPYLGLPLITCVTLFITIELGAEGGMPANQMQLARYVIRALPLIMFPFIMNFPAAVLCYWVSTNAVTLLQVGLLKIPGVKPFLKIPERIQHPVDILKPKKSFSVTLKETLANMKMAREMEGRLQADQMKFRKAGMGPVPKTYKFDPTKQRKNN